MAWTTPVTATSGAAFNASSFNATIRDNLLETAPGKATTAGRWICASGSTALVERTNSEAYVGTDQSTTTTTYTDLTTTGPAVTLTTGTRAIVSVYCGLYRADLNIAGWMSYAVSGATTIAASDDWAFSIDGVTAGSGDTCRGGISHMVTLTAGNNTFTAKYRATSGTTANFLDRRINVWCF